MILCSCGEEIEQARWKIGYRSCKECGEKAAQKIKGALSKLAAPAYNKGPLMPMFTKQDALDAGRK